MPRGHPLDEHIEQIKAWACSGMIDQEIAVRLGANWESVARLRRVHHIPNGREVLMARMSLRQVRPLPLPRKDPEIEWTRLLNGRRFDEPGMVVVVVCK